MLTYQKHIFLVDTFPVHEKEKITQVGKDAHELQGVLLTLLCFLLLHGQLRHLEAHIGGDQLGSFVKMMELTLLMEEWLNKNEFMEEELCVLIDLFLTTFIHLLLQLTEWMDMEWSW